ncbi:MAG TPA: glycosyltransferase [Gemmatimonadaceae bacterium]|nr:glycosyltransferase [Gemmatimonadaceae bacterium]
MTDVTVVVPTRNRAASVLALLRHLRLELQWSCPVVVVDQSDDGGAALAAGLREAPFADVVQLRQEARGTGTARNAGARLAGTPWLLLLDDDVRPARGYLQTLQRYVADHPWVDAVQPGLEQRAAWEAYCREPDHWLAEHRRAPAVRHRPREDWDGVRWFTNSPRTTHGALTIGVASGNLLISRRAFFGAGGFDEQIEGRGDDSEFGLRLWWYGYRVSICPQAMAFHLREEHGGTRDGRSRWSRLLEPDPPVGWVYFYRRWFPGAPYRQMWRAHLLAGLRRPWALPVRAVRLWKALRGAEARFRVGPRLLAAPVPRDGLPSLPEAGPGASAAPAAAAVAPVPHEALAARP